MPYLHARSGVAGYLAVQQGPAPVGVDQHARVLAVADRAAPYDRVASLPDLDPSQCVGDDLALLQRPLAVVVDQDSYLLAIADAAPPEGWAAPLPDLNPGQSVAEDLTLLHHASAVVEDENPSRLPIPDCTMEENGIGRRALNGHARERVGADFAPFQDRLSMCD